MKINLLLFVITLITAFHQLQAQQEGAVFSKDYSISWKILQHNFNSQGETLSELTLSLLGKRSLERAGWAIYFNGPDPHELKDIKSPIELSHVNGDFYRLRPTKYFKGLAGARKISIKILSRHLKNRTDYGKGFYMVFDDRTAAQNLSLKVLPASLDDQEKKQSRETFVQNQSIKFINPNEIPPVFPSPLNYIKKEGSFRLSASVKITADQLFSKEADYLQTALGEVLSSQPHTAAQTNLPTISLKKIAMESKEGYELDVESSGITISASDRAGIFYGIQSLRMIFSPSFWKEKTVFIDLPALKIMDAPRFGHRAFMMDIARNFQPKSQIIKVLDLLSLYKINVFHLHFNDDEGWRIEIKDLPELTEVGSKRAHTVGEEQWMIPAYGSGPTVNHSSGYLSRADFVEILKYATLRHIRVIPEYETPGHARAAIKSMDARYRKFMLAGKTDSAEAYLLRDLKDNSVYSSVQGFNDNVINPALPSTYRFMEKIIDETISMYRDAGAPLNTIHFGGDEVPNGVWEKSPAALKMISDDLKIKTIDELWYYYFQKVSQLLASRNLYLSGWEEIGLRKIRNEAGSKMELDERGVAQNYHADVWNNLSGNEDLAYKLANAGYKVVLTNVTNLYLDLAYNKSHHEPGQYWGGYVDVNKPFSFIPLDYYKNQNEDESGKPLPANHYQAKIRLSEQGKKNIIGLQAPLWSEVITTAAQLEYLLLPKILGLAERSWAADPAWAQEQNSEKSAELYKKAWSVFINRLGTKELPRLDHYGGGFQYRIPAPGYAVRKGKVEANVLYPGLRILYTTDGTIPTAKSKRYTVPIDYSKSIRLRVFNSENRGGSAVKVFP
ncbi:family 20 glycosylhydrolase [Pedobacter sp.]|uniref:family 20 glycosylhydrolase n=1 Tax=Pedobacter sp. TaxID=1411316 RepID=UPI003BACCDAA